MIIQSKLVRVAVALTVLIALFIFAADAEAAIAQLSKDTEVKVKFAPGITLASNTLAKDAVLLITLAEPLDLGGKVIVEAGARGTAKVTEVKPAGGVGKAGYIKIEFQDMETKGAYYSPEDKMISLAGAAENEGKGKGIFPYLFVLLVLKGGQGEIDANQTYTATVAETIILESK